MKIELGEKYIYEMTCSGVSLEGRDEIDKLLRENRLPRIPKNFNWAWKLTKGKYVGTFPKRISKLFQEKYHRKIYPIMLELIGNIAKSHLHKPTTYALDFTDRFDWEAGDFGDHGSCFWSCHKSAKDIIVDHGGMAVRFYHVKEYLSGIFTPDWKAGMARAWILPAKHSVGSKRYDDYAKIIFNGYGLDTLQIAKILARFLGKNYRRVEFSNCDKASGDLWINGGTGYLLGKLEVVSGPSVIAMELKDIRVRCCQCEKGIKDGEQVISPDNRDICRNCHKKYVIVCGKCKKECWKSGVLTRPGRDKPICGECAALHRESCWRCGYSRWKEEMKEVIVSTTISDEIENTSDKTLEKTAWLCQSCFRKYTKKCEHCGQLHYSHESDPSFGCNCEGRKKEATQKASKEKKSLIKLPLKVSLNGENYMIGCSCPTCVNAQERAERRIQNDRIIPQQIQPTSNILPSPPWNGWTMQYGN